MILLLTLGCLRSGEPDSAADTGPLVEVPAATFSMGCDPLADPACGTDELPAHEVSLSAFAIGRTEVSWADYRACVEDGVCPKAETASSPPEDLDLPVTSITIYQAEIWCEWRGWRLPTEAEWELAARGTDGRIFPWGDEAPTCDLAQMPRCGGRLAPVEGHRSGASPSGALNMSGNAWEMVSDHYDPDYYADSPSADPPGPDPTGLHVVRGASFYADDDALRASDRVVSINGASSPVVGFRCAVDR